MNTQAQSAKLINILLWAAQVLLAAMFLMAGVMKTLQPIEALSAMLPWTADVPEAMVRFIGISEFLGALGLLLPSLLRIQPQLTPLAAGGLALVMLLAAAFHGSRGETEAIGFNVLMALVALFVAWGRSRKAPIAAKA